jgi:hypothetical protein
MSDSARAEILAESGYQDYQIAMEAFSAGNGASAKAHFSAAKSKFEQALHLSPLDADMHHIYGGICAHMGLAGPAEKHFLVAIELAVREVDRQRLARFQGGLDQLYQAWSPPTGHSPPDTKAYVHTLLSSPPFEAYKGTSEYVFVSYAHKDGPRVFREVAYLYEQRYRIWYDEGIDPGNEWPEEIANALADCAFFIVFISANSVDSKNVRNEINFALNKGKPFLAIHIDETALPAGLELRMGDIQAVMQFRMSNDSYRRKLTKTLPDSLRNQEQ